MDCIFFKLKLNSIAIVLNCTLSFVRMSLVIEELLPLDLSKVIGPVL